MLKKILVLSLLMVAVAMSGCGGVPTAEAFFDSKSLPAESVRDCLIKCENDFRVCITKNIPFLEAAENLICISQTVTCNDKCQPDSSPND